MSAISPVGALLVAAVVAAPLTGIWVAGERLVDIVIVLALAAALPRLIGRRIPLPPWWLIAGVGGVCFVLAMHQLDPAEQSFMGARYSVQSLLQEEAGLPPVSGLVVGAGWLLTLAILPWLAWTEAHRSPGLGERLAAGFLAGTALSALVAVSDQLGITHVALALTSEGYDGRQVGLTNHPNHLGFSCAMAIPLAIGLATRRRGLGLAVLVLLGLGVLFSGSRGAQAGALVAIPLVALLAPAARRPLLPVGLFVLVAVPVALALRIGLPADSDYLRFGGSNAEQSDALRELLRQQAEDDFHQNPFLGVGINVLPEGHNFYLQLLGAGGVVLFAVMAVYWAGALWTARRLSAHSSSAVYLAASVLVSLAMGLHANQIVDRYLLVPVAVLLALAAASKLRPAASVAGREPAARAALGAAAS
ncbi:MAG: O-antigen ligase family protein [Sporichthyaceae bacterium]